jgi:hypothetical protein
MRYLTAVLIAGLLAMGVAEAEWYWHPPRSVQPLSAVGVYTGLNNARCIAGIGNTINVVYSRDVTINDAVYKKTYFRRSTDMGATWGDPHLLAYRDDLAYDAVSPSIGLWTPESLLVVWNDGHYNGAPIYIRSRWTTDGGDNWEPERRVDTRDNTTCRNPALFCENYPGSDMTGHAVWSGVVGDDYYIRHREGTWLTDPPGWAWAGNNDDDVDVPGNTQSNYPSIWSREHGMRTAYMFWDYGNQIWYENGTYPDLWDRNTRSQADDGDYPSITYDGTDEVIAYEKVVSNQTRVKLARKTANGWEYPDFTLPAWADSAKRPHLFAADCGNVRRMYLGATGFHTNGSIKKGFVQWSSDGGTHWNPIRSDKSNCIFSKTDSVSLWAQAFGNSSYLRNRVWAVAAGHTTSLKSIKARVASEYPVEVGPPAGLGPFGGNSACRVTRQPGTDYLHRALPIENFISYERSCDNGATWDFQDAPDYGSHSTLALCNGNPTIAYLRNDSVFAATLNPDSEWTIQTLFAGGVSAIPGPPTLAMFSTATGRFGNVAFPVYGATAQSKIVYIQFDTCGNLKQNLVDSLPGSYADSFPCISVSATDTISVVYQHSINCYKRRLVYSPTTNSTIPDTWPGASAINSTQGPTIRYPFCERIGSRLWVTYSYENQGNWVIKRVSCLDTGATTTWEGEANLSNVDANPKYYPVLSTPAAVAWTESLETHCAIMANVSDSLLQLTGDTSCCWVSLLADTAIRETPSTNMTRIRYLWLQKYSGDTWTVPYAEKEIRVSDAEANVTRYNQGAKLAIASDDSLSSVYRTSQGSIYFCRQKDGDAGWSTSLLSNSGESPAVANSCHDRIWTCERDASSPAAHVIRCHNRATGSGTWQSFTVYSVSAVGQAGSRLGPAAIAACPNDSSGSHDAAYITFTVYTSVPPKSTIVMAKVDTGGVIYYVDTLHSVASFNDSFPSVALAPVTDGPGYVIEVGWQNGSEVYTRRTTNYDHPEFITKRTWNPAYNLSNTQSSSRHPLIAANSDTILVAWVEGDSGRILVKGQTATSAYNSWGDTVNVSHCPDSCTDNPGIALGDSNVVTYQKKLSSTNYDIIARVNFHSNLNLSNSTTISKYPHCLFHFHDGSPVISTVWTEELSANYAEVAYKRWQLGEEDGGGIQDYSIFDPNIRPTLFAPAPNPFNGLTNIRYATNIRGMTRVSVMDITGRRVRNLLTMPQSPGIYNLTWNARDDRERQLPRGVYFVRLETTNYSEARKLILTE